MDMKAKLVGVLEKSLLTHVGKSCKLAENIANDLIDNGVTVQEWISVKDRLPEEGVEVLALCWHHEAWQPHVCYLSTNFKGRWITSIAGQWMMNVSHWMPLPQPLKGE